MIPDSILKTPLALSMLAVLTIACSNEGGGDAGQLEPSGLSLQPPAQLLSMRAIQRDQLSATLTANGASVSLTPNANNTVWSADVVVTENQSIQLSIEWFYEGLPVARLGRLIPGLTANTTIPITSADYVTEGEGLDFDSDGYSNLAEFDDDFDPRDASSPGGENIDVVIPWISPSDAPTIDGLYDNIWNSAQYRDREGNLLAIDNLMIDLGARFPDGATDFQWAAMHDNLYLYLYVFAETFGNDTPIADSRSAFRDDNLNLFLDGDNSKRETYDGVDDRHFFIPFLNEPRGASPNESFEPVVDSNGDLIFDGEGRIAIDTPSGTEYVTATEPRANNNTDDSPGSRLQAGVDSAPLPADFQFANCLCSAGRHTYELKISLAEAGIAVRRPFGIGVQIDDDTDGGNRDARYGWIHPTRSGGVDTDLTWQNPSYMGTAYLE